MTYIVEYDVEQVSRGYILLRKLFLAYFIKEAVPGLLLYPCSSYYYWKCIFSSNC